MGIKNNITNISSRLNSFQARLVAVSKTQPVDAIAEAYAGGQRIFGENKVQELVEKQPQLPSDIAWHLIGHLQTNKVKYIAPFISLIHSVDSIRLLSEINKQGLKNNRVIHCLLQVYIAKEESKFGLDFDEVTQLIKSPQTALMKNVTIDGLMGMASLTDNQDQIRREFWSLKKLFDDIKNESLPQNIQMVELSMGMSSDYSIALEVGSTLVRIGTAVFGNRI